MSKLFESTTINGMTLKNRFVRSATFEAMADDDGVCQPALADLLVELAKGDVGLIIIGFAYVNQIGRSRPGQTGVYADTLIPALTDLTTKVHQAGGKIAIQTMHAGCNSFSVLDGEKAIGPWPVKMPQDIECRAMTGEEIDETIADFVDAAVRAKKCGFDAVQLHGAHGYLLSQFLSPYFNKRTDAYGGSLENRARIIVEILRGIRSAVGSDYPVMIKINSEDYLEGGFSVPEMLRVAAMLEAEGIDAIEVSGGTHLSPAEYSFSRKTGIVPKDRELYFEQAAKLYRERIQVPLMLVGGIRSYSIAERVIDEGLADYVSLCRPLIREPHLVRRWQSGDTARATCISCNECFTPVRSGQALYCVAEAKLRRKKKNKLRA